MLLRLPSLSAWHIWWDGFFSVGIELAPVAFAKVVWIKRGLGVIEYQGRSLMLLQISKYMEYLFQVALSRVSEIP
jgi:hypothetical protein